MKPQLTMHDQHNQLLEALADSLVRRMWRGVILPGISLQLALFVAFSFSLGLASLSADDDNPPVLVANLPDEGQPPAPSIEQPAVASEEAVAQATKPEAVESPAAEKAAVAQPPTETVPSAEVASAEVASAEVASAEQIERLSEKIPEPQSVRELSVEPVLETRPMLPADRPAWVGAPNETSERVHRLYVASFTTSNRDEVEADELLDDPLVAAVQRYLYETVFPGEGAMDLHITPEFVRSNLLDKSTSYVAAMTTQSGTEYQKWVVLQVTPEQREYFAGQLREHKQRQRMTMLGVGLGGVLGLTGLANLAFNRRRRRYPNALTPVTMAIMPGDGMPGNGLDNNAYGNSSGNKFGNPVQLVAAGNLPVINNPVRKKRCCGGKSWVMVLAIVSVLAFMLPALLIKSNRRGPHRSEATRIEVDGRIWEIKKTRPLFENELNGPN